MARSLPPVLLGILKTDEKAPEGFVYTVWRLDSGHLRMMAQKADVVELHRTTGKQLKQLPLVDVDGNPVEGLD